MTQLPKKFKTMDEVRKANADSGLYFFHPNNMDFFKSNVESELISSLYFITSELGPQFGDAREFSIREVVDETGRVKTVKRGFKSLEDAQRGILKI